MDTEKLLQLLATRKNHGDLSDANIFKAVIDLANENAKLIAEREALKSLCDQMRTHITDLTNEVGEYKAERAQWMKQAPLPTDRHLIEDALVDYYGNKCPDYDADCKCCQAWSQFEALPAQQVAVPDQMKKEPKEELVVYGGFDDAGMIDLFCSCEDAYMRKDSRIVMFALKMSNLNGSGSLLDELVRRGYDVGTLKLTISAAPKPEDK